MAILKAAQLTYKKAPAEVETCAYFKHLLIVTMLFLAFLMTIKFTSTSLSQYYELQSDNQLVEDFANRTLSDAGKKYVARHGETQLMKSDVHDNYSEVEVPKPGIISERTSIFVGLASPSFRSALFIIFFVSIVVFSASSNFDMILSQFHKYICEDKDDEDNFNRELQIEDEELASLMIWIALDGLENDISSLVVSESEGNF